MIIPNININDGLEHSYQNEPPGYSEPQSLFYFHYDGIFNTRPGTRYYNWTVNPPFIIVSGQGLSAITCQLLPQLNTEKEPIVNALNLTYVDYKYSTLTLKVGPWEETLNLYYKQGPLWKIEGNKTPIINEGEKTIETYTLIPQYNQIGYPPKNETNPDSYSFKIKNGKVIKFHGGIPPTNKPMVDIWWYEKGSGYLSFYSAWKNESLKFPNTINIIIS